MNSKRNGWCTVVNESLLYGKPVICNKYIGASVLINNEINGIVLNDDKHSSLLQALNIFVKNLFFLGPAIKKFMMKLLKTFLFKVDQIK